MKSKGLFRVLTLFLVSGFVLTGCDENQKNNLDEHVHTYETEWSFDEQFHWHAASCEHSDEVSEKEKHIFGQWVITKNPTETEEGEHYKQCTICGYKITESMNMLEHVHVPGEAVKENKVDATCTRDGSYDLVVYCTSCGEELERNSFQINATGHDYIVVDRQPATFDADGFVQYECSVCHDTYREKDGDQLVHSYSQDWSYDKNTHWHECLDEGYSQLKGEESAHTFSDSVVPPTNTSGGYTLHTCICGYSYTDNETDMLTYTITWVNWDGNPLEIDTKVTYGSTPSYDGEQPTKPMSEQYNYAFAGWSPEVTSVTGDATYTAIYSEQANIFEIQLDANGGSCQESIAIAYGDSYNLPVPVRDGYEFAGWYNDETLIPSNGENWIHTSITELKANWNANSYRVKLSVPIYDYDQQYVIDFDSQGGTAVESQTITSSNGLKYPNLPYKERSVFRGWFIDKECTQVFDFSKTVDDDHTLYAGWYTLPENTTEWDSNIGMSITHYHELIWGRGLQYNSENMYGTLRLTRDVYHSYLASFKSSFYFNYKNPQEYGILNIINVTQNKLINTLYCYHSDYYQSIRIACNPGDVICFESKAMIYDRWGAIFYYFDNLSKPADGGCATSDKTHIYSTKDITYGENYSLPVMERDGFEFLGWYDENGLQFTDKNGNSLHEYNTAGNITLYAIFNEYCIFYHMYKEFGCENNEKNVNRFSTDDHVILYDPSARGYKFEGWYLDSNYQNPIAEILPGEYISDVIVYAKWSRETYSISYELNGGEFTTTNIHTSYNIEQNYSLTTRVKKKGYSFGGWYLEEDFQTDVTTWQRGEYCEDLLVYAKWIPLPQYDISYHLDGGVNSSNNPLTYNTDDEFTLEEPTKKGYTFNGWYLDSNFENGVHTFIGKDYGYAIDLYAKWTVNSYSINLYVNEINFKGPYTVSFETNGANEIVENQIVDSSHGLKYPGVLTKNNYAFKGWYSNTECTEFFDFSKDVKNNTIVYAGWEEMSTTNDKAKFYVDCLQFTENSPYNIGVNEGGTYSFYYSALHTGKLTIKANYISSSGYSLMKVYNQTKQSGDDYWTKTTAVNRSFIVNQGDILYISISASKKGKIQISFDDVVKPSEGGLGEDESNLYYSTTTTYGESYNLETDISLNGYSFDGWSDNNGIMYTNSNGDSLGNYLLDSDLDLFATWSINNYDITYHLYGGTNDVNNLSTFNCLSDIDFYAPTKEGYYFDGWYLDEEFQTKIEHLSPYSIFSDINLYAKWIEIVDYSITYHLNGGENNSLNPTSYNILQEFDLHAPTKHGYEFVGWYLDEACTQNISSISGVLLRSDLDLYAKWSPVNSSVTFIINEIDIPDTCVVSFKRNYTKSDKNNIGQQTVTNKIGLKYPNIPTRSGYAFTGWYVDRECTEFYDFTAPINNDIDVYAGWEKTESVSSEYYLDVRDNGEVPLSGITPAYFTALNDGVLTIHYQALSNQNGRFRICNNTTGEVLTDYEWGPTNEWWSIDINAKKGNVYRIEAHPNYNLINHRFKFTPQTVSQGGVSIATTHIYSVIDISFDESFNVPMTYTIEGYEFIGWFDENNIQYTDKNGAAIREWDKIGASILYAHWAEIS